MMSNYQNTKTNEIDLVLFEGGGGGGGNQAATLHGFPQFLPAYCTLHMHKIQIDNDSGTFQMSLIRRQQYLS